MTARPRTSARRWAAVIACLMTVATAVPSSAAAAPPDPAVQRTVVAADCPKPGQPDVDYLCPIGPTYLTPGLTDVDGWDEPAHYRNLMTGDLDGDGVDELVARGTGGTQVFRFRPALGQWSQVLIDPVLSDSDGWDQPKYYETIQLGDIDGDGRAELVARSPDGVIVFRYQSGGSPDAADWTRLTTSGPMNDAEGWGNDPGYYETIQLVPLGRSGSQPTMQLMGRGADGLELYRWNGTGWSALARLDALSDANGWRGANRQILVWDERLLLARGRSGMDLFEYTASSGGPGTWRKVAENGPCRDPGDTAPGLQVDCNLETIRLAHGVQGVPADHPVILTRPPEQGSAS